MVAIQFQELRAHFSRKGRTVAMPAYLEDHGLPLVQLKEQRRELVVALMGRLGGPVTKDQIADLAEIQHAIAAVEAVIVDLDAETYLVFRERQLRQVFTT
jgi:hypothetical protein